MNITPDTQNWLWQIGGMIFIAYSAYSCTVKSKSSKDRIWLNAFWIIVIIAAFRAVSLGTEPDPDCDPDPIYGGCHSIQSFNPTPQMRSHVVVKTSLWLLIPITMGIMIGLKIRERRNGTLLIETFEQTLKAAKQGDTCAQCKLARMYYSGQGTTKNYIEGLRWNITCTNFNSENFFSGNVVKLLGRCDLTTSILASEISETDIKQAAKMADEFKTHNVPPENQRACT